MKLVHKIKIFIILQIVLSAVTIIAVEYSAISVATQIVFFLIQIGLLVYLYKTVGSPLKDFAGMLKQCLKKEDSAGEILRQSCDKVAFANSINDLVNICSAQATKINYAIIHDKQAELKALQSQINPHSLYNILDSIRGQALIDNNIEIAKMVKTLADFFRYSISRMGELVTLRDELANVKNYMTIQQYRFNNRYTLKVLIEEEDEIAYDFLIPKLIIQPIVENAVYHGLKEMYEGGIITVEVILTNNNLILMVSDNGKGMDYISLMELNKRIKSTDQVLLDAKEETGRHTGIALSNIHKRIQLLFGDKYGIQVFSSLHQGTDVEIMLPANFKRESES